MRQRIMVLTVAVALGGALPVLALPASATGPDVCGSSHKLSVSTPYNKDSIGEHLVAARGSLTCGPYPASHQWELTVRLEQYHFGAWHVVASKTSGWRTARSGNVRTTPASVSCLAALRPYQWRARATGYWRSSSTSPTKTIGSTLSSAVTRYC